MTTSALFEVPFRDPSLLEQALTHTSWAHENNAPHNERLEFLGDAVLQLCASELLYSSRSSDREGELTRMRQQLVCTEALAALARSVDLGQRVRLGRGEENSGGRDRDKLLADVFEAVLGALYLDQGPEVAFRAGREALAPLLPEVDAQNPKVALQEWAQARSGEVPRYEAVGEEGPDHSKQFRVVVSLDGVAEGEGTGSSKQRAEYAAARAALKSLGVT